jgi:DNA-binding IclR family transcriptional regulator
MKRTHSGHTSGILETVWMNEGVSRIDLVKRLGTDKSTVSHLVGDLIEAGPTETAPAKGCFPPMVPTPWPSAPPASG